MREAQTVSAHSSAPGMLNRWLRHLVAGGLGTLIYMGLVAMLVEFAAFHPVTSVVIAFIVMEFYTYVVNRAWVYAPKEGHRYAVPRFLTVTVVALSLNTGIMYAVVEVVGYSYFWGLVATALVVPLTNFLLNYFWAFR